MVVLEVTIRCGTPETYMMLLTQNVKLVGGVSEVLFLAQVVVMVTLRFLIELIHLLVCISMYATLE